MYVHYPPPSQSLACTQHLLLLARTKHTIPLEYIAGPFAIFHINLFGEDGY